MEKLFFYDLETTGTKHWENGIHQISGCIMIEGKIVENFNFKVRPHKSAKIEATALAVGNVTREEIENYPEMSEIYSKLIELLSKYVNKFDRTDKFHLVGYNNASFDNQFFRAFFEQNNDKYFGSWFWSDSIDVYVLASNKLKSERSNLINFKQGTVAKYLGIDVDETKLHNAEYDIILCTEIYKKVS